MATETLILRPTITIAEEGALENPSDTAFEDFYKLVNEEISDNDSTTLSISANEIEYITLGYNYNYIKELSSAKIFAICKSGTALDALYVNVKLFDENQVEIASEIAAVEASVTNASVYHTYEFQLTSNIINSLNSITNGVLQIQYMGSSSGNKVASFTMTQTYIELTCQGSQQKDVFMMKENDDWKSYQVTIYKKLNNSWVEKTEDIFKNESRYIVKNI